jgi:hypothetical protein
MSLSSLPWTEANAADSRKVASILRLEGAKEKDKFSCIECASSDGLHAYQGGGLKCYACGKWWSNVDAAAHVWGLFQEDPPIEALKRLATDLGIFVPEPPAPRQRDVTGAKAVVGRYRKQRRQALRPPTSTPPRPKKTPHRAAESLSPETERLHQEVYGELLYLTGLSSTASSFLNGRGLNPEGAEAYGFRSISPKEWGDVEAKLESMTPEHRAASGLYTSSGFSPPFGGYAEVLVLPYYRDASDHAPRCLRFRNLTPRGKGNRYRDLHGNRPAFPFNAQAMTADDLEHGREIVLTEGELDAYTLHERGEVALGFSGTSLVGLEWLLPRLRVAGKVVAFFDADDAGDKAVEKLRDALQAEYGPEWVKDKLTRRRPMAGKDANDLRVKGLI